MSTSASIQRCLTTLPLLGMATCSRVAPPPEPALPRRSADVPVVLGDSDELCGPALLRALLLGYGKDLSFEVLIPRLDIDEEGTSIDSMEDLAITQGLPAEQIMNPADLTIHSLERHLPAIVSEQTSDGHRYYQLLWDQEPDGRIEVLDCSRGRGLVPKEDLEKALYIHEMDIPSEGVDEWLREARGDFAAELEAMMTARGLSPVEARALLEAAQREEGWLPSARLDATLRAAARMGRDPRELLQRVAKEGPEAAGLVDADWFVRASAASGMVRLRGAVFLQVVGTMEPPDLR